MDNGSDLETRVLNCERDLDRQNAEIAALRMIATGLMAKWAKEDTDPQASAFRMFEAMIASLHSTQSKYADHEPMLQTFEMVETALRFTLNNVQIRLGTDG